MQLQYNLPWNFITYFSHIRSFWHLFLEKKLSSSDEFELKFSELSRAEKGSEPS